MLPEFEIPFKFYIDAAFSQGLAEALHQRKIVDGEPREGLIFYISRKLKYLESRYGETQTEVYGKYDHHIQQGQDSHQSRWPLDNVKSNPAYDPEVSEEMPINFMESDRKRNFRFSQWEPGIGTSDIDYIGPEETETLKLGITSSEVHNKSLSSVNKSYAKIK
ncbi:hypothetical protein O181_002508 [Austropuccinia psidii MF-1]|uniref:Uncharacterized protein n=1 Tax=Austropuccinia psidii MF-1 TaxID=1389203 RepID=A0A9Q3BCV3_9BASI|nr:hypothetical protein [Austropuccinia psidii MF-1]